MFNAIQIYVSGKRVGLMKISILFFFIGISLPANAAPGIHMSQMQANGIEFSYLEAGDPSKPLILFLHGFPDTADTWNEFLPIFGAAGFHAVAPFMRGYNPTAIPANGDYSVETLAHDALAIMDGFHQDSAIIVGHDWGAITGYVAANMAPQRVKKLVTLSIPHPRAISVSPAFFFYSPQFAQLPLGQISEWFVQRNNFAYLDALYAKWSPAWRVPENMLSKMKEDFSQPGRLGAALGYYRSFIRDGLNPAKLALLRQKTSVPTLCLVGNEDGATNSEWFAKTPEAFTGPYELDVVKNSGHFIQREQPEVVLKKIFEFLGK